MIATLVKRSVGKKIFGKLGMPVFGYIGGGIVSIVAIGALKILAEKYPQVRKIFNKGIDAAEDKLEDLRGEIAPEAREA